jgi:hypothetical protein
MNSTEAYKGFISFLILAGAIGITFLSFKYVGNVSNLISFASNRSSLPKYVEVSGLSTDSAVVNWYTAADSIGVIIYSKEKQCFEDKKSNYQACTLVSESSPTKNHKLTINALDANTTYYYKIKGDTFLHPEDDFLVFTTAKNPIEEDKTEINTTNSSANNETDGEGFLTNPTPANNQPDAEGFSETTTTTTNSASPSSSEPDNEGFSETSDEQVLGISTRKNAYTREKVTDSISEEFKEALIYNNLRYDFDKNGKVEVEDYPLYIMFIKSQED